MSPADFIEVDPMQICLHEIHPALRIKQPIRKRLINLFVSDGLRRFSKHALQELAEAHPLVVVGKIDSAKLISGWVLHTAFQSLNFDKPVACIRYDGLTEIRIRNITIADFFFSPLLPSNDEIAHRIYAIEMQANLSDVEMREFLNVDCSRVQDFYDLPIRKRQTLFNRLRSEEDAVQAVVSLAPKPLGAGLSSIEFSDSLADRQGTRAQPKPEPQSGGARGENSHPVGGSSGQSQKEPWNEIFGEPESNNE